MGLQTLIYQSKQRLYSIVGAGEHPNCLELCRPYGGILCRLRAVEGRQSAGARELVQGLREAPTGREYSVSDRTFVAEATIQRFVQGWNNEFCIECHNDRIVDFPFRDKAIQTVEDHVETLGEMVRTGVKLYIVVRMEGRRYRQTTQSGRSIRADSNAKYAVGEPTCLYYSRLYRATVCWKNTLCRRQFSGDDELETPCLVTSVHVAHLGSKRYRDVHLARV